MVSLVLASMWMYTAHWPANIQKISHPKPVHSHVFSINDLRCGSAVGYTTTTPKLGSSRATLCREPVGVNRGNLSQ